MAKNVMFRGEGGGGLAKMPKWESELVDDLAELKDYVEALRADVLSIRTKLILVEAKLDDDATVTDTNYEELGTPAAMTAGVSTAALKTVK